LTVKEKAPPDAKRSGGFARYREVAIRRPQRICS
jgi:hypothetical protein